METARNDISLMKKASGHSVPCRALVPHAIVVLWLIYLGAMVWQHSIRSVQAPFYDPLTYMQKAMNFWKAVDEAKWFNPLNIAPTSRPPGTILMSYPFGFSSDYKGFHFRSVFFPIVCIVIAVYMAAGMPRNSEAGWGMAAVAILFSAMPMLYSFDNNDVNPGATHWGLVDNFQAGIAAMAAAGYVKSLKARSLPWLTCGALAGSFTLLIKPSGLMVMALLTATWLIVVTFEWLWAKKQRQPDTNLHRYMVSGGILSFLIYAVVILLCVFSNYFSMQNFVFAKHALKVMFAVEKNTPPPIFHLLLDSAGIAFLFWMLGNGMLMIYNRISGNNRLSAYMLGLLAGIPVIWGLGVWYWLVVQSGGSQVRYVYPFFVMGAVLIVPISIYMAHHVPRWIRLSGFVLCLLPALNIGVLLAMESPPIAWQQLSGVNVSVGNDRDEVNQARTFLDELRRRNKRANLYLFFSGILPDIFATVGVYEEMVRPDLPVFKAKSTVDWMNGFAVRTDQLLNADYILIRKDLGRKADKFSGLRIDSSDAESVVFQAWLCGLNKDAGIRAISDGRVLRLLEIVDRKEFERAVESFVSANSWRTEFMSANSVKRWSTEADVLGYVQNIAAKEIEFDGLYALHAISPRYSGTGLKVELWWEELHCVEDNRQWYMFFHLVDSSGKMLLDLYLTLDKYDPPFDNRRWRYGSVTFEQPLPNEATSVAFGIFSPNRGFLMPDKGERDWGGLRVLIPIPASDSKSTSGKSQDARIFSKLIDRKTPHDPH